MGAPFTLASYIVEGGSSKNYTHIKRLAFAQPDVLHALLSKLADNVADYVRYQVGSLCTLSLEMETRRACVVEVLWLILWLRIRQTSAGQMGFPAYPQLLQGLISKHRWRPWRPRTSIDRFM